MAGLFSNPDEDPKKAADRRRILSQLDRIGKDIDPETLPAPPEIEFPEEAGGDRQSPGQKTEDGFSTTFGQGLDENTPQWAVALIQSIDIMTEEIRQLPQAIKDELVEG